MSGECSSAGEGKGEDESNAGDTGVVGVWDRIEDNRARALLSTSSSIGICCGDGNGEDDSGVQRTFCGDIGSGRTSCSFGGSDGERTGEDTFVDAAEDHRSSLTDTGLGAVSTSTG